MMNEANITTPTNGCRIRAPAAVVPMICINQLKDGETKPSPLTAARMKQEGGDPVVDTFRRGVKRTMVSRRHFALLVFLFVRLFSSLIPHGSDRHPRNVEVIRSRVAINSRERVSRCLSEFHGFADFRVLRRSIQIQIWLVSMVQLTYMTCVPPTPAGSYRPALS